MSYTGLDVLGDASVLLNDPNKIAYPAAVMLPFLNIALQELNLELLENGASTDDATSSILTMNLTAGLTPTSITDSSTPALPADFLLPIEIHERLAGSQEQFIILRQKESIPERVAQSNLIDWVYEGDVIKFVGATTARDIKILYQRSLSTITDTALAVSLRGARLFLSSRTAALIAGILGGSEERSSILSDYATNALTKYLNANIKESQNINVRRRPFGYDRRNYNRWYNRFDRGR